MTPSPILLDGERLKVHAATAVPATTGVTAEPGTVVVAGGGPAVVTGDGWLRLDEGQAPGGRAMTGAAYLRGRRDLVGALLSGAAATA